MRQLPSGCRASLNLARHSRPAGPGSCLALVKLAPGRQTYQLADSLSAGAHTAEIYKESYTGRARMTFLGFDLAAARLIATESPPPRLRIEFYGDSNLAGFSLAHEKRVDF